MTMWMAATSRGGGRALGSVTAPKALSRQILSCFTQGASSGNEKGGSESSDGGGGRRGSMAGFVAEKAKKGTRKAAEMVFEKGESRAAGKKESWGYVKETTRKIKDDLLGDHPGHNRND